MRTGSCAVQQGLTPEAASIVKQAVALAKRRGHAQVTPLHVASTMLSITNGLLRNACLQSHSHPLQCKALELCFNVALNRLPASNSSPMLGHHHHNQCPSISNALIAAFKRAQAHQRRGSIENQQQPLLTVKIEIEQLIISILDDPSVSRVMREARFSSLQVKSNVEQAVSLEICSKSNNNNNNNNNSNNNNNPTSSLSDANKSKKDHNNNNKGLLVLDPIIRDEDISSVIENLVMSDKRRIKSIVIVGECVSTLEGVVKGVMDKVEKGQVSEEVLRGVKFFTLSLSSLVSFSRVEVEQKVEEIRKKIMSSNGKGCVLYLGDLKWVIDFRANYYSSNGQQGRAICYCPVDHMIMEIAKLVSDFGDNNNNDDNNGRFWVMGVATFQAYMKCKNGEPSLESLWGLHPISIPSRSLSLSLISGVQNQPTNTKCDNDRTSWLLLEGVGSDNNYNNNNNHNHDHDHDHDKKKEQSKVETSEVRSCKSDSSSSNLPAWLQQYKNENRGVISTTNDQDCVPVRVLGKKWNLSMCNSMPKLQSYPSCEKALTLSPASCSSTPTFSNDHQNPITNKTHPFWISSSSNPSSNPNSTSSSDTNMEIEYKTKFKEFNSENLKTLYNALEEKVPIMQKEIIHEIVSTLLQCRSGIRRRKRKGNNNYNNYNNNYYNDVKGETWFFFQGVDVEGAKEKLARELAKVVFGSQNNFVSISLSNFSSSTREDSSSEEKNYCRKNNKRSREGQSCNYIERFIEAVSCNPHRVFFVEDIEQVDYCSLLGFKRAIERGKVEDSSNGEEFGLCDAVIILSCESFISSRSRACSPNKKSCEESSREEEKNNSIDDETRKNPKNCVSLDLNISIDDDGDGYGVDEDRSMDEIGLVESVDGKVIFKNPEL